MTLGDSKGKLMNSSGEFIFTQDEEELKTIVYYALGINYKDYLLNKSFGIDLSFLKNMRYNKDNSGTFLISLKKECEDALSKFNVIVLDIKIKNFNEQTRTISVDLTLKQNDTLIDVELGDFFNL